MQKKLVATLTFFALVLVSCVPGAAPQNAMMDSTPTQDMMKDQMDEKGTVTSLPVTGGDVMMDKTTTPEMVEKTHEPMMITETPPNDMMEKEDSMTVAPGWYSTALTDAVSGETFRIVDFEDKVVLVETFAQWCPTCLRQQKEFVRLHEMLGMPGDLVTISLDVDPNEDVEMLQGYVEKHGFDWRFAVTPAEAAREIGSLYGQQFLNPPSAPVLIIDRNGKAHTLPFGVKSAEELQEELKRYLDSEM